MDIDRALQGLLHNMQRITRSRDSDAASSDEVAYEAFDASEHFAALDQGICATGELPERWQRAADARAQRRRPRVARLASKRADNDRQLSLPMRDAA